MNESMDEAVEKFFRDTELDPDTPFIRSAVMDGFEAGYKASGQHSDLSAEVERLKEALEHYADKENWICSNELEDHVHTDKCTRDWYDPGLINRNGYEVAQTALEGGNTDGE